MNLETDASSEENITVQQLQLKIESMFGHKDAVRGVEGTYMWLMEEVGELAAALRKNDRQNLEEEFADVLAWVVTLANITGIDLTTAIHRKYGGGCPRCHASPCACDLQAKP